VVVQQYVEFNPEFSEDEMRDWKALMEWLQQTGLDCLEIYQAVRNHQARKFSSPVQVEDRQLPLPLVRPA
jgi:hypothetical protein